ncbi:MAG: pilus assembly protein [Chloroflexota bacterium]|nr:pilus assembly protein [Chloroflexota bacterium]MDE3194079.1 pilus assembly protein [Chloroflexota bacterium]
MTRLRRDERGQAITEFALVLPVFLLTVFGVIDLARAVWEENELAFAAREGTRYAIVHGAYSGAAVGPGSATYTAPDQDTAVTSAVLQYTTGIPNVTVRSTWPDGDNDRNSRVAVDVTAPFLPLPSQYLLNGALSVTLRGGSMLIIQR